MSTDRRVLENLETATVTGGEGAFAPSSAVAGKLEAIRAEAGLPALAAAVWRGGTLIGSWASGVRKLGDPTPVTTADEWHLGSDTKAMTATLIGLLVDRGQLAFSDRLDTVLAGETIDPGYRATTIEQLLQHRGGAPAAMPADIKQRMWSDGDDPGARIRAVRSLLSRPPAQAPGTYAYANAGYLILGIVLERIAKTPWENMIRTELFAKLGMTSAGFGPPGNGTAVDQPWGHTNAGNALEPGAGNTLEPIAPADPRADNPPAYGPAGRVHVGLADWGKFLTMHVRGARGEPTLLSAATMARLHQPPPGGDYAAGWRVTTRDWAGGVALTHTGSNLLWLATTWLGPARDVAFATATNCCADSADKVLDDATCVLIEAFVGG